MSRLLDQVREHAMQWILRLEDEPDNRELMLGLEAWLKEDDLHRRVFQQVHMIWSATGQSETANRLPLPILSLLCFMSLFLVAWFGQQPDLQAPTGKMGVFQLSDGSALTLAPESAVNIRLTRQARVIELRRGAVYAEVDSRQLSSPFVIATEAGQVRALGTRFSVQLEPNGVSVRVYESAVELTPASAQKAALSLVAGEAGMLYPDAARRLTEVVSERPPWLSGELVFQRAPLQAVLATLQRYDRRWQWSALPEADLEARFSGVLRPERLESAYAVLAQSMALVIDYPAPGIIRIQKSRAGFTRKLASPVFNSKHSP